MIKVGITFANAGPMAMPEFAASFARGAEAAGFESLWTIEHVLVPAGYESEYPYSRSGKMPGGEDVPMPDPLIWLAWVGARTERIRLGTGILILPQRNPAVLAKSAATVDVLTGGRLMLGVGVGWLEEEFVALGVPFAARGRRTDDYIRAMRALWADHEVSYQGEFVTYDRVKSYPKPHQEPGVPIVIGGHSPAAARRAGRLGDGFFPARGTADELLALYEICHDAARTAGRDPAEIELTAPARRDPAELRALKDAGVARFAMSPPALDEEGLRRAYGELAEKLA